MAYSHTLDFFPFDISRRTFAIVHPNRRDRMLVKRQNICSVIVRSKLQKCYEDSIVMAFCFGRSEFIISPHSVRERQRINSICPTDRNMGHYMCRRSCASNMVRRLPTNLAILFIRKLVRAGDGGSVQYCFRYFSFTFSN